MIDVITFDGTPGRNWVRSSSLMFKRIINVTREGKAYHSWDALLSMTSTDYHYKASGGRIYFLNEFADPPPSTDPSDPGLYEKVSVMYETF